MSGWYEPKKFRGDVDFLSHIKIGGVVLDKTADEINAMPAIAQQEAIADLDAGADLATTVTKVNAILAALRAANIIAAE